MHASSLLLASVAAVAVMASPSYPELTSNNAMPGALDTVSSYFNVLAEKAQQTRQSAAAPVCDLSKAIFPANSATPALPPPSAGLVLKHVAIGRGTQNYTCDIANATAVPVAAGALATLFNASCVAASYPDVLDLLPRVVLPFNLSDNEISAFSTRLYPTNLALSGHHYFKTATTAFFDLDTPTTQIGQIPCGKTATQSAPSDTVVGSDSDNRGQQGEAAVAWLKLAATAPTTGGLQEVYRLQTVGGSPPAKCAGMPAEFTVQYAAEYWFYETS
ncbi:uncharacterized protein SPSK_05482 [Sporothrix schenckii 1099-18]|uniref:Malate dehydrogenase n=2 Tax=Sporothrix schenckii TaxID=29908 RepID=U7Q588_SPOS1|nr:uncharacterized protein SPSK_05482 [Sporothrix schenckii 1099-18]ERT02362.1 hypothetical protein HMPREF1624_00660 [Sporothrix schenckii ATCC 58251]KJR80377.1 hypothetical protein SPSK_05482 [Sporothrix schenckii 1099-18]